MTNFLEDFLAQGPDDDLINEMSIQIIAKLTERGKIAIKDHPNMSNCDLLRSMGLKILSEDEASVEEAVDRDKLFELINNDEAEEPSP